MILASLILIPVVGGLLAWLLGRERAAMARTVAVLTLLLDLAVALVFAGGDAVAPGDAIGGPWRAFVDVPWIPSLGARLQLGLDALSWWLVLLTILLALAAVLASWREIRERSGAFHLNLLLTVAGILGVFTALDLLLFYVFWELMLLPMVALIALWGHERRRAAAIRFFLYTQLGGLLLLVALLGLHHAQFVQTGVRSFALLELSATAGALDPTLARWLCLGFVTAFLVKLPAVPVHAWLPLAHTQAPTAGSVILAGLLLKTGAYGLLRIALPLFGEPMRWMAPVMMVLGVVGILYGALLALGQNDLKRLVAYTSVSHMGFVLLGVFAFDAWALRGVVLQMICHGLSTGALFVVAGQLQERLHTRRIDRLGGLQRSMPRMAGFALVFAMASLGLPGLGNFVAEFLVLAGSWRAAPMVVAIAAVGLVVATVYVLHFLQGVFHGPGVESGGDDVRRGGGRAPSAGRGAGGLVDLGGRESMVLASFTLALLWLGLYPQPVLADLATLVARLVGTGGS